MTPAPMLHLNGMSAATATGCADRWGGTASGGIRYVLPYGVPNRARIEARCPISPPTTSDGCSEYDMSGISIDPLIRLHIASHQFCPGGVTAARNVTRGSVKALYR